MKKITFNESKYTTSHGIFRLPVPDGYQYGSDTGSGNENWLYVIPDRASLFDNHIDAKPFSFAITTFALAQIPFDIQKIDGYKKALVETGALSRNTWVDTLILSSNSAFFYQCWTDTAYGLFNKVNGLLFAGADVYKFHVLANYDEPVAGNEETLYAFIETALSWMGKVTHIGDLPYRPTDMDSRQKDVSAFIDKACELVTQSSSLLGITMDFATELRKHFTILGGLLYQHHNIALTYDSVSYIAKMTGRINGRELDAATMKEILDHRDAKFGSTHDYLESYSVTSVIKQLVKLDKLGGIDEEKGITHGYFEAVEWFLRLLCLKNQVSFSESDFYIGCKAETRRITGNVWDSVNIQVFPGSTPELGDFSTSPEPFFSADPIIDSDFEMDDDEEGKLTNYAGAAKNVVIPCGVEIIGENAFLMKQITSVVIPEGVTELEDSAFWGCKQLASVKLPTTLEKIGPDAFRGCESLTSIVIPEGVWEIEADAFSFCTSLKHIYLPESLWSIGYDAFSTFCDDMKLHVPQFSSAETYAQDNDLKFDHKKPSKTTSAEKEQSAKPSAKPKAEATSNAKDFIIENNKVTGYFGNATEIVIPEGVTAVATEAYVGNESTKRIVIPEGVKTLGRDAFASCGNLTEVVLPMSLTTLGGFACCSGLKQIHIPTGVKTIGPEAFSSCTGLTEIILPYGLKKISKDAFFACTSLKDVHIPETVTDIHKEAFSCATFGVTFHVCQGSIAETFAKEQNLKIDNTLAEYAAKKPEKEQTPKTTAAKKAGTKTYMVEDGKLLHYNGKAGAPSIPKDVTIIGTGAFDGSETLLCIELSEAVKKVETGAFVNCPNLFRIIVPESVTDIARGAFVNCPKLYLDTMEGSYAAKYGAQNGIPVKTDGLYGQRPEISEKVEAARLAAAEAERVRKEEEARRQREYEERCRREAEERERKAAEEAERRRKVAEEAERYRLAVLAEKRNRYDQLMKQVADQNRIISENRGWFGAQAKARKAAKEQLAILQAQLAREFPNGRP